MEGQFDFITGTKEEVKTKLNNLLETHFVKIVGTNITTKFFIATIYVRPRLEKQGSKKQSSNLN